MAKQTLTLRWQTEGEDAHELVLEWDDVTNELRGEWPSNTIVAFGMLEQAKAAIARLQAQSAQTAAGLVLAQPNVPHLM